MILLSKVVVVVKGEKIESAVQNFDLSLSPWCVPRPCIDHLQRLDSRHTADVHLTLDLTLIVMRKYNAYENWSYYVKRYNTR